ncbi:ribonuclease D [Crocosphaera watsonii WH 8501]|uniref:3'-5' exonuclease n=5 Tax=Crocosphaera watsonii TaxID=263511 RepID=Q4C6G3_CROWT|nr:MULTISPECIES: ribonuclease H-like domain-containing protein [Crocosphaera]EAM52005.1 3'-5' exonuclease [Crocosphaera watsonii WH 8501]EHJ13706.1 Ribonuclease D related protein [Crocosphaera watsonii WH 0003]MCH2243532.1 ribonuclease H-like domain-containing protein [Crocosphaera sp.]NQZ62986.1 ribonuclease D [Crocosphaera sp.]CCQ51531.1 Ribonuclease D related protein [Crocosphaera watsonii WH 8502]
MTDSSEKSNNFQVCDRDLSSETLERYLKADALAIDTETMGLVPQRDRLCLVQLCDPSGYVTAIRIERGQTEAPNLKQLLENKNIVKIFHYARFDVGQFKYNFSVETDPIFCTKVASKLARTYTGSHGLKSLVQELEGVELDKSSQSSDWGNSQNLSEAQLSYAANDVRYLIQLREQLITMLKREERWEIAQKCMKVIPLFVELDLMYYKDIFDH